MFIHRIDDRPFAFAGLREHWEKNQEEPLETYTILTGEPNDLVRPIHTRMPVILQPEVYDQWLDPELQNSKVVHALLKAYPSKDLTADRSAPASIIRGMTILGASNGWISRPENYLTAAVHPLG